MTQTSEFNELLDTYLNDIIKYINKPVSYKKNNKIYTLNKKTILNYVKKQKIKKFIKTLCFTN